MLLYDLTLERREIKLTTLIRLFFTPFPMIIGYFLSLIRYPSNDSFDSLEHAKIVNKG